MAKFKDSLFGSALILALLALVVTFMLVLTYTITKPRIDEMEVTRMNEAREVVLPGAVNFEEVKDDSFPSGVEAAYKETEGKGYVFRVSRPGYGGPITFMIGVDAQGACSGISVLSHEETPGLGAKITEPAFMESFVGVTSANEVDSITGATVSSMAMRSALSNALEAWEMIAA